MSPQKKTTEEEAAPEVATSPEVAPLSRYQQRKAAEAEQSDRQSNEQ